MLVLYFFVTSCWYLVSFISEVSYRTHVSIDATWVSDESLFCQQCNYVFTSSDVWAMNPDKFLTRRLIKHNHRPKLLLKELSCFFLFSNPRTFYNFELLLLYLLCLCNFYLDTHKCLIKKYYFFIVRMRSYLTCPVYIFLKHGTV